MLRILLVAAFALIAVMPAHAQSEPQPRPIASSTAGPWEGVVWGVGWRVHFCTMVRVKQPAGEPSYGMLVDQRGTLFSVETDKWTLSNAPTEVMITPANGSPRTLTAKPVSTRRANIDLSKDLDLLDQLQRSDHVDVRAANTTVRLAFDDFNAARVVLELCVQQIGKDMPETKPR